MKRLSEPGAKLVVGDRENRDPMPLGQSGSAPPARPTRAAPRRADRLRSVLEKPAQAVTPLAELRKTAQPPAVLSRDTRVTGTCSTIPKSSWKEEVRNQQLQARFLAGKGSLPDPPLYQRGRSSWREEMENQELRQGKSVRSARQIETREEADMVERAVPKPPPPPPTASEMEEIKAKVQKVVTAGVYCLNEDKNAVCSIVEAFRASKTRYEISLNLSARKIQTIWRGVGPRREMAAALRSLALKHVAATMIQKTWRMIAARYSLKCFIAAKTIQTTWRAYSPRTKYMHYLVSKEAAIRIQSAWRSFRCYCLYTLIVDDIVIVQRVARLYIERRKCLLQRSATHIQRVFRGKKGRKTFARKWKKYVRERSARNIQRVFRGTQDRIKVARVRTVIHAATTIQTYWRGYETRQNYWLSIGSAIDIQSMVRGIAARKSYSRDLRCIVLCQSAVRRWHGRRHLERLRHAKKECESATTVQALWRCYYQRQQYAQYKVAKAAATKIQSAWRSFICYSDYIFTLADIVSIQRLARKYIGRMHAATTIQKTWRKYLCYTDYIFTLVDIVTIQRSVRGHIGRKIYATKHEEREQQRALERLRQRSATNIQRVYRGSVDRSDAAVLRFEYRRKKAAVRIQSLWRAYVVQGIFLYKLTCAIQIQSWTRGLLGRLHYIDSLGSIILAQCAVRRWIAARKYNQMRLIEFLIATAKLQQERKNEAVLKLQQWYRSTVHPKLINQAASKVQCFFRMAKAILDRKRAILMKRRQEIARLRAQAAITLQSFGRRVLAMRELAARANCKRQTEGAITIQTFYRMTAAIAQRNTKRCALAATKIQSLVRMTNAIAERNALVYANLCDNAATKIQSLFHMTKAIAELNARVYAKRCDIAAMKIQSFFRMIKAMVDREIQAEIKRRKIRKMLKNRTKAIDDFLLEEAWQDLSIMQVASNLLIADSTALS